MKARLYKILCQDEAGFEQIDDLRLTKVRMKRQISHRIENNIGHHIKETGIVQI